MPRLVSPWGSKSLLEKTGNCGGLHPRFGLGSIDRKDGENGFVTVPALLDEASDPVPRGVMFAPVHVDLLPMFLSTVFCLLDVFLLGDSLKSIMFLPAGSLPFGLLSFEGPDVFIVKVAKVRYQKK